MVSITTRCLKHLFDKKPAEEFHFILDHLHLILMYPDNIYKNKLEKRGEICFTKRMNGSEYLCSIEQISPSKLQIVTAFRLRDPDYIKNYTILWNRGSGKPHRHALEFPKEPGVAPQ
jgi:predicted nucleic acid-binding protein